MSYEGTIVLNYRLAKKLGEGGFGTVYLAEHTELGRKAACKILHREFANKPEVVERFFREAKAVCAIGHRAIIDIENFGALPSGEPFYLMEYFPGASLAEHAEHAPLQPAQLITVFDAVASALAAAHGKQIIHRDLKPENIMVLAADDGAITDVKLLDFGIAKLVGDRDSVRSRSGMSMGTPSFMSPEQAIDAKSVDARTDVYSFAATVYAAIAGQPPFLGDSVAVLLKVQTDPPSPLATHVPSVPAALAQAIEHCLAKRPDQRPATIGEAWQEIRTALAGAGPFARAVAPSSTVAPTLPPDSPTVAPATVDLRGAASTPSRAAATANARPAATAGARPAALAPATTLGGAAGESLPMQTSRSRRTLVIAVGASLAVVAVAVILATRTSKEAEPATAPIVAASADASAAEPAPAPIDAVALAEAPDAALADASVAVAIDAAPNKPRPKPPTPKPGSGSNPPPPSLVCTPASFAAVYTKPAPTEDEVRAALDRLNKCRAQLPADSVRQIQQNLVSKL